MGSFRKEEIRKLSCWHRIASRRQHCEIVSAADIKKAHFPVSLLLFAALDMFYDKFVWFSEETTRRDA